MIRRLLSQTLGAIKKGYAVDTFLGPFSVTDIVKDAGAIGTTNVLASTALANGAVTVVSGGAITNPDVLRCLRVTGNQASVYGNVVITGYDAAGDVVTDTILASGTSTTEGVIPMAAIAFITLPARQAASDQIAVGLSAKLGLRRPLANSSSSSMIFTERKASAASSFTLDASVGTVDATNGTVSPSGGITASDSFKFNYLTTQF